MLVLVGVTKYNRKWVNLVRVCYLTELGCLCSLSSSVFRSLRSIVLEPEQGPPKLRILAAAILRELSPLQKSLVRDFNPPTDPQNIPYVLPVLLSQVIQRLVLKYVPTPIRYGQAPLHIYSKFDHLARLVSPVVTFAMLIRNHFLCFCFFFVCVFYNYVVDLLPGSHTPLHFFSRTCLLYALHTSPHFRVMSVTKRLSSSHTSSSRQHHLSHTSPPLSLFSAVCPAADLCSYRWLTHLGVDEELCVAAMPCLHVLCTNSTAMEKLTEGTATVHLCITTDVPDTVSWCLNGIT